jgi:hypothetical protein
MEPGTDPADALEPTERERAVSAGLLGLVLGVVLVFFARGRRTR